ncbi:hypothetical protein [Staphylococcus epidermidis]|nr:hypothetical protein [Staphylococcus epidermidis]
MKKKVLGSLLLAELSGGFLSIGSIGKRILGKKGKGIVDGL